MFKKILIANRGEVALRVMRACKELGVKTVAVYSTEDANTYLVQYADEAVCIGPAQANKSYLIIPNIIAAAKTTGAEAVHPGYGFLAENADFARACADNDLVFIGPAPECIERMGDKSSARETMKAMWRSTVPGSDGCIETAAEAKALRRHRGLSGAHQGDGRRRRRRACAKCTTRPISRLGTQAAQRGRRSVRQTTACTWKLVPPAPRGDQVLADDFGNNIAPVRARLSVQRRHQKLIEARSPPALTEDLRARHGRGGHQTVRAVNYKNAGTIEFLLDERGSFYFMEMNTRVQVEHPVTEQITGTDIIKEQLRVASGEPMSCADRAPFRLQAMRWNSASTRKIPSMVSSPCPGTITKFEGPDNPGVRGKLRYGFAHLAVLRLACGEARGVRPGSRGSAARAVAARLGEFVIEGIETTIAFHRRVLDNARCSAGRRDRKLHRNPDGRRTMTELPTSTAWRLRRASSKPSCPSRQRSGRRGLHRPVHHERPALRVRQQALHSGHRHHGGRGGQAAHLHSRGRVLRLCAARPRRQHPSGYLRRGDQPGGFQALPDVYIDGMQFAR